MPLETFFESDVLPCGPIEARPGSPPSTFAATLENARLLVASPAWTHGVEMMAILVRPIRAEDWALARAVRLRALAEAPDAFAATLDQEQKLSEDRWRERADDNARGERSACFLADDGGVVQGMAVGVWSERAEEGGVVELNALWVAPEVRGRGVGRGLCAAVLTWGRARGARRVELEVTETSREALALYAALGFEAIREPAPTCGQRGAMARRMSLTLQPSAESP
jgi:ribosomal protein S18 acetylase RimI-like enzyme